MFYISYGCRSDTPVWVGHCTLTSTEVAGATLTLSAVLHQHNTALPEEVVDGEHQWATIQWIPYSIRYR